MRAAGHTEQRVKEGLLWSVNEALQHRGVLHVQSVRYESEQTHKSDARKQLTSATLLRISAASSYSGFIFLQCPHPEGVTNTTEHHDDGFLISNSSY